MICDDLDLNCTAVTCCVCDTWANSDGRLPSANVDMSFQSGLWEGRHPEEDGGHCYGLRASLLCLLLLCIL